MKLVEESERASPPARHDCNSYLFHSDPKIILLNKNNDLCGIDAVVVETIELKKKKKTHCGSPVTGGIFKLIKKKKLAWRARVHLFCAWTMSTQGRPLTGLEDLVSDGEARPVRLVVGHELDEELVPGRDHGRRGDLPAVLPHQLSALVHAVPHLHIVVPVCDRVK